MSASVRAQTVAVATGSAVVASGAWYAAFADTLARYDPAYAASAGTPAWVLPVEFARSGAVASAVAILADRMETRGPGAVLRLGLGPWAAFPVVLLTGSVVHEHVPAPQAAIHAGDWLVKLLLISAVVGRATATRPTTAGRWRRIGRAAHQRTVG
jgi:hypothetical protein